MKFLWQALQSERRINLTPSSTREREPRRGTSPERPIRAKRHLQYLKRYFDRRPSEWVSGHDLHRDNERREADLDALRRADAGHFEALLEFVGEDAAGKQSEVDG